MVEISCRRSRYEERIISRRTSRVLLVEVIFQIGSIDFLIVSESVE